MTDAPLPLSPDDEQHEKMTFAGETGVPHAPYAWVSVLVVLGMILLVSVLLSGVPYLNIVLFAALLGLLVYLLLDLMRPQVCPVTLTVVSAILGVILSLPAPVFYGALSGERKFIVILVFWLIVAGLAGWQASRLFNARKNPTLVPPIAFFLLLVGTSLWHLYLAK